MEPRKRLRKYDLEKSDELPATSATSPEYYSCEENVDDEYKDLFTKRSYFEKETFLSIDYYLNNSIGHSNFDSDLIIAAFHGCLRIGRVISNNLLENETGLNKDNLIEIPIFLIPKFVIELQNCLRYLLKEDVQNECSSELGEIRHRIFLFCKKTKTHNKKQVTFYSKKHDCEKVIFEVVFYSIDQIEYFIRQLFCLILDTTYPSPYQQELTILFLKKIDTKPEQLIKKLYSLWERKQKLDILFNAICEVIFEKEKKEDQHLFFVTFNFIKKHITLIQAMQKIYKVSN